MNKKLNRFCVLFVWLLMFFISSISIADEKNPDLNKSQAAQVPADDTPSEGGSNLSLVEIGAVGVVGTAAVGLAVVNTLDATLGSGLSSLQPAKRLDTYFSKRNGQDSIRFSCDTERIVSTGRLASSVTGCKAEFLFEALRSDESLKGRFMPAKITKDCDEAKKICSEVDVKMTEADGKVSIHHKDKLVGIFDFSTPNISFYSK
ncbi:MAG TPA: hypothetical protein VN030_02095 [Cellvibrio sp.]|nr:hypothetical protein [Cellvibrio sp.]